MKILVCGTNYGSTYIRALTMAHDGLQLGGVLSRGSTRSRRYAQSYGVPHYSRVEQLAGEGFAIACVAVPGDAGVRLALDLLHSGLNIIIEHPLSEAQYQRLHSAATAQQRQLFINGHFADLDAPIAWLNALASNAARQPLLHLSIDVNLRTIYSALDLVGRIWNRLDHLQVLPLRPDDQEGPEPFAMLALRAGSFVAHLLVQNYASEHDDGSATLLNHRLSACFANGNLLLAETNGPVLWYPTITSLPTSQWSSYVPVDLRNQNVTTLQTQRDRANLALIHTLAAVQRGAALPPFQQPQYLQALTRLWDQVLSALQPER
ncbi:MAG: hypothetical protein Tsb002_32190 [Wenzhouxiangellaceae bacterium]